MVSTLVITNIPSPYQVELFNGLAARQQGFRSVFLQRMTADRQWQVLPLSHEHRFFEGTADPLCELRRAGRDVDLVVFSNYSHPAVRAYMAECQRAGRPWCYWGERPGFRSSGLLGRLVRRWRLAPLHAGPVPIWGMGGWAVNAWRREFGERPYFNVPYFSDLSRFTPGPPDRGARRFLYSGSLILRKGVDLLVAAFLRLLPTHPEASLTLVGTGELEAELKRQCQGHADRIRFLGFRDWEELPAAYAQADFLCAPSRYDGWNLVVPEGLAAGLPVISTDRTGAALDLIEPGVNGWRVPAGQEEPLFQTLGEAAALSDAQLAEMRTAAQETAQRHSLDQGIQRWLAAAEDSRAAFALSTSTQARADAP